jgi:hypothetical protein
MNKIQKGKRRRQILLRLADMYSRKRLNYKAYIKRVKEVDETLGD